MKTLLAIMMLALSACAAEPGKHVITQDEMCEIIKTGESPMYWDTKRFYGVARGQLVEITANCHKQLVLLGIPPTY